MSNSKKINILFTLLIVLIFFIGIAVSVFRVFFSSADQDIKEEKALSLKKIGNAPSDDYGEEDIATWFEDTNVCLTSTVTDVVFQSCYTDAYNTFSISKYITTNHVSSDSDISDSSGAESSAEEVYATIMVYQKDFDMYCSVEIDGETAYLHCTLNDVWGKITPPDFNVFSANLGFEPNITDVVSVEYVETDSFGDKIYDVVKVGNTVPVTTYNAKDDSDIDESDAASSYMTTEDQIIYTNYYINTKTGMCEYMSSEENNTGLSIVTNVGKSDDIVLPEEFLSDQCTETDYASIEGYVLSLMYFL